MTGCQVASSNFLFMSPQLNFVYMYIYLLAGRNRKFNVTRERLDDEINKLNSEGFEVWRTS